MSYLIGVASARTQGCTSTAVNLAAALARRGMRVVLVDLDARGGRVGHWLGVPDHTGLALAADMRGRRQTLEDLRREVRHVAGLAVLTGMTRSQEGILEMGAIARTVRELDDFVVADLGVLPGDAQEAAGECDEILLLARPDQIGVAAAREVAAQTGVGVLRLLAAPLGPATRSMPADLERAVKLPVVGVVPFDPSEAARSLVAHRPMAGPVAKAFDRLAERVIARANAGLVQAEVRMSPPPARTGLVPEGSAVGEQGHA